MDARFADGRAAVTYAASCDIEPDALVIRVGAGTLRWPYADLARADDGNGTIILKRKPDTGERVILDTAAETPLRPVAPALFTPRAQGVESPGVVVILSGIAASLAALFLIGVPMAAEPIAQAMPQGYRDRISELTWQQVNSSMVECTGPRAVAGQTALYELANRLDAHLSPDLRDNVDVFVMQADVPNAFALPDDSIIITDQLIAFAEGPDELAGVIAHELGHVEGRHVLTTLIQRLGAGVFFDVVFGGAGLGQAFAIGSSSIASMSFSREYETDADARGLDMMERAHIDPHATAALFERIAAAFPAEDQIPPLLRSHPAHADRAAAARARASGGSTPSLTAAEWQAVRSMCATADQAPPALGATLQQGPVGKPGAVAPPPTVDKGKPL